MTRAATKRKPARCPAAPNRARSEVAASFLRRRGVLILGLALLAVFVHDIFGERGFRAMRRNQREVRQLEQEIEEINEDNRQLAKQVKALKSDPKMIERLAREQMGLARPGELIIRLPAKPQETTTTGEKK